jgi:DNA-binding MarR family transcriptional regulator
MVALVDDLEERGLAVRRRSPTDRRAYAIELTEAGAALQGRAQQLLETCEREFLSPLGAEERRVLQSLLERLAPPAPRADGG